MSFRPQAAHQQQQQQQPNGSYTPPPLQPGQQQRPPMPPQQFQPQQPPMNPVSRGNTPGPGIPQPQQFPQSVPGTPGMQPSMPPHMVQHPQQQQQQNLFRPPPMPMQMQQQPAGGNPPIMMNQPAPMRPPFPPQMAPSAAPLPAPPPQQQQQQVHQQQFNGPPMRPPLPQQQPIQAPTMQSVTAGFQQLSTVAQPAITSPSPKPSRRHYPGGDVGMQPPPPVQMQQQQQPPQPSQSYPQQPTVAGGMPPVPGGMAANGPVGPQFGQVPIQTSPFGGGPGQQQQPPFPQMTQQQQQQQQQQRTRISADSVPSHNSVQEQDQECWDKQNLIYKTMSRQAPPLASTDYIAVDEGQTTPRFIRATTYNVATTGELLASSKIPLGLIIQPLAELRASEPPIEVVDMGERGPVRCNRCKAYINPLVRWSHGGQKYICNICDMQNDVPADYFANLDMSGRRVDWMQRPELRWGTVDFVATKEFCSRPPTPASFVFLIDVSWNAVQSGMLQVATQTIKEMLDLFPVADDQPTSPCKISIVTFDRAVHFYNLNASLSSPQMLIVSDTDDVFVPLSQGFLVSPDESRENINSLLDQLPNMFASNRISEACLGAAVQAASMAVKSTGGRLIVFQTILPAVGPGSVKNREDPKLLGTDKERSLFAPQEDFYVKLAGQCVESGIGIDLFLFPSAYIDIATIGALSAVSGGHTYMYPNFMAARDGYRFAEDLRRVITRNFGFDGILRVRCGNGLRVAEHFGNFHMRNSTDVEFGVIDSEKALAVQFTHDSKLSENTDMSFQVALLYTSSLGRRLIRVMNYSMQCTAQIGNLFRLAEMDSIVNFATKSAISRVVNVSLASLRDQLTDQAVGALAAYRKFCASNNPPGQLILPESCKLYPLFTMCILKHRAFRPGTEITSDFRIFEMRRIRDMNVQTSINYFYPRMFSLTDLPEDSCEFSAALNRFVMPPYQRTCGEKVFDNGAYLLENGSLLIMWIGRDADPSFAEDIFGVPSIADIDISLRAVPVRENARSQKICALLHHIQEEERKGHYVQLQIIRQGDAFESQFRNLLIEDPEPNSMGYVDYLCQVHRQIQALNAE